MRTAGFAYPQRGFLIEPLVEGPTAFWEGHHATNPCAIRLGSDPRVFLGYRAGGWNDGYQLDQRKVWSSHLGMAVLSIDGSQVDCRLPLPVMTNDIVFIRLADDSLKMIHRPVPDNYIVDTEGEPYCPSTPDGVLRIGTVQQSVRPGRLDNSHIGNNGLPSRAQIGTREVYVDVVHGVTNHRITDQTAGGGWDLEYLAYLRVLDFETGKQLYYSDGPVFESDEPWRAYCREGAWVSMLDHLRSVMFVGGQVPADPKKTGLDDKWYAYVGAGDTAVALAQFTLRDLLPEKAIVDIQERIDERGAPLYVGPNRQILGHVEGWEFAIENHPQSGRIAIVRELQETAEKSARLIALRPGYIDASAMWIEEYAAVYDEKLGWLVKTWLKSSAEAEPVAGLLLLDRQNPERILYRSDSAEATLPAKVVDELLYTYQFQPMDRAGLTWLKRKAAARMSNR